MRFAIVGAGAVGGYYGALLSRSGSTVSVVARGAHLDAIRRDGLRVVSGAVGDFAARVGAESDPARIGVVDVVLFAVKSYDNPTALPLLEPLVGPRTVVLTLQNGVDSADEVAAAIGRRATLAGATYIATAVDAPGVIKQTGSHRRIVFGEVFDAGPAVSDRVRAIETVMKAADIHAEAVADARPALWEKFAYLAPFAAITGATRLPLGPVWADPDCRATFLLGVQEVADIARASGVRLPDDLPAFLEKYAASVPGTTRSSLLIDLSQGKRIEIESLAGSVVRRGRAAGVPTPVMATLYAVLKPYALGATSAASAPGRAAGS
jgi:2-dehydropantoate 2-reductase